MDTIETSKEFGKLDELVTLEHKVREEIAKDELLPKEDPEIRKIEVLNEWLNGGKTEFGKMKIRFYAKNYRGVHARRNIKVFLWDF